MRDDRLLKQVLFGKTDGKNKIGRVEDPKEDEQTTWWTGARKIGLLAPCLYTVQTGG